MTAGDWRVLRFYSFDFHAKEDSRSRKIDQALEAKIER
jgi:hypothetical protein